MISGKKRETLNAQTIFSKISSYDIFRYYIIDKSWKLNSPFLSPLREETHPSFVIGNKSDSLNFIDFSNTALKGDCFTFVKLLFCLKNLNEVFEMIDRDFGLGIKEKTNSQEYKRIISEYEPLEKQEKRYSFIQVVTRKFNKEELDYWNEYYQDIEDLKRENVYAIKNVYFNKSLFPHKSTTLRFGYYYDGFWKIYKPFEDKKNKWMPNNVPITTMDGLKDIKDCDVAFINKSKKDYMVMKKIFPCCCAVQNEGMACFSDVNLEYLKNNSNKQILGFDSDETGKKNSLEITKKFDFGYCNVPNSYLAEGIKDFADWARHYDLKTIENYLKQKQIL